MLFWNAIVIINKQLTVAPWPAYFALVMVSTHSSLSFSVFAQKKYCLAAALSVTTVKPPCTKTKII